MTILVTIPNKDVKMAREKLILSWVYDTNHVIMATVHAKCEILFLNDLKTL